MNDVKWGGMDNSHDFREDYPQTRRQSPVTAVHQNPVTQTQVSQGTSHFDPDTDAATDVSTPLVPPLPTNPNNQRYGYAASAPPRKQAGRRRQVFMGGCLAIGGALLAFGVVALIVAAILLPPIYRAQRPEIQEIWCSRADRVGMGSIVCEWKPTPPFENIPTLAGPTTNFDPMLILTPATATPGGTSTQSGAQPAATQASVKPTATPSPTRTPTLLPTSAPTSTPLPTSTPTAIPIPESYKIDNSRIAYHAQWWNNCGPATLTMSLSYFGYNRDQGPAANFLKPNSEDKNVSPFQMVAYVNEQASANYAVRAMYRIGGDAQLLKTLLSNDFPVIIEKGYEVNDLGWMGHYLLLIGYDDNLQTFYSYDSYLGHGNLQGRPESYQDVEYYWRHFNHLFLVIYDPARETQLLTILGNRVDPQASAQIALEVARNEAAIRPDDNWAWFNIGSAYTILGEHELAAQAYDQAFAIGMPWRTLWYLHTPYESYYALGRYDDVLALAQSAESTTVNVEETFFYRGGVYAAQGNEQGAVQQFNLALSYNKNFYAAATARDAVQNGTFTPALMFTVGLGR